MDFCVRLSKTFTRFDSSAPFKSISKACWRFRRTDVTRPSLSSALNAVTADRNDARAFDFSTRTLYDSLGMAEANHSQSCQSCGRLPAPQDHGSSLRAARRGMSSAPRPTSPVAVRRPGHVSSFFTSIKRRLRRRRDLLLQPSSLRCGRPPLRPLDRRRPSVLALPERVRRLTGGLLPLCCC